MRLYLCIVILLLSTGIVYSQSPVPDYNDPRNWISIYEISNDKTIRPIFLAAKYRAMSESTTLSTNYKDKSFDEFDKSIDAVVDKRSSILIRFDRGYVAREMEHIRAAVSIRGYKNKVETSIPGYSEVGKTYRTAKSGSYLRVMMEELSRSLSIIERVTAEGYQEADDSAKIASKTELDKLAIPISTWQLRVDSASIGKRRVTQRSDSVRSEILNQIRTDFSPALLGTDTLGHRRIEIEVLSGFVSNLPILDSSLIVGIGVDPGKVPKVQQLYQHKMNDLQVASLILKKNLDSIAIFTDSSQMASEKLNQLNAERDQLLSKSRLRVSNATAVPYVRAKLKDQWVVVGASIKLLTENDDSTLIDVLADLTERNPKIVRELLVAVYRKWIPSLLSPENIDSSSWQSILDVKEHLGEWVHAIDTLLNKPSRCNLLLAGLLKDTEVMLPRAEVAIGDVFDIDILNGTDIPGLHREFQVRFKISQFGLVRNDPSDTFMFIKRNTSGVPIAPEVGNTVDTRFNFKPTAGISQTWTWHPRNGTPLPFIAPGLGFNISFPQFGRRVVKNIDSTGTVEYKDIDSDFGIGVGPVLTLLDGSLQFTLGYFLTNVETDRFYWGLGFSLIRGFQRIKTSVN